MRNSWCNSMPCARLWKAQRPHSPLNMRAKPRYSVCSRSRHLNSELHQTLCAAAHNRYLLQSITTVVDALGLLRHSTFVLPGSIELAHREHLQIITAVRDRNSAEAERLARQHVNHALAMRLELQRLRSGGA